MKLSTYDPLATPVTRASAGPTYSAAYLSQLKAATPGSRPKVTEDESFGLQDDAMNVDSVAISALTHEVVDLTGTRYNAVQTTCAHP